MTAVSLRAEVLIYAVVRTGDVTLLERVERDLLKRTFGRRRRSFSGVLKSQTRKWDRRPPRLEI
jgi:hypothetical protein